MLRVALALGSFAASACGRSHAFDLPGDSPGEVPSAVDEPDDEPRLSCPSATRHFADEVLVYDPDYGGAPPVHPDVVDPEDALGPPDYDASAGYPGVGAVSLGQGGRLELAFRDCRLSTDGTSAADVRIYEVGPAIEAASIYLRASAASISSIEPDRRIQPDDRWFFLGYIGGSVNELDVDVLVIGAETAVFDAIRIDDDAEQGTGTNLAWGADVDAVELLSWGGPSGPTD